ncbi:hypothetical protein C8R43DRAFT_453207 [Mycena crocata]|nr:hypothetical protein C8R43DRAFT_453207 [Mycena crocata]
MSVLPEELIEHIIDVVQSEHPTATLHACSLVSHQFFPRSRHHIFSTLTLNLATEYDLVDVAEFLKILESPLTSTTLIPYIRALTMYIFEDSKFFTPLEILSKLAYAGINPTRLEILGKISRVAVLLSDRAIPTFTASVTDLSLLLTDNVGLDELAAYICAFCATIALCSVLWTRVHRTSPSIISRDYLSTAASLMCGRWSVSSSGLDGAYVVGDFKYPRAQGPFKKVLGLFHPILKQRGRRNRRIVDVPWMWD